MDNNALAPNAACELCFKRLIFDKKAGGWPLADDHLWITIIQSIAPQCEHMKPIGVSTARGSFSGSGDIVQLHDLGVRSFSILRTFSRYSLREITMPGTARHRSDYTFCPVSAGYEHSALG